MPKRPPPTHRERIIERVVIVVVAIAMLLGSLAFIEAASPVFREMDAAGDLHP